jgi:homoserine kinase type II
VPGAAHDPRSRRAAVSGARRKALALIEFLPGVSVADPTPAQARAVGAALAQLHLAAADFPQTRANGMDRAEWQRLLDACGHDGLAAIDPVLADLVEEPCPARRAMA